jgi:hypothetical protein
MKWRCEQCFNCTGKTLVYLIHIYIDVNDREPVMAWYAFFHASAVMDRPDQVLIYCEGQAE